MLGKLGRRGAVHLAFGVATFVLVLAGAISYDATLQSRQAAHWVLETQRVLGAISEANEQFAHLEAAQRGYLLWGSWDFLREREAAIARLKDATERIGLLTADNDVQQRRNRALEAAATDWIRLALESSVPRPRALSASVAKAAQQAHDRFLELSTQMHEEQVGLLQQRQTAQERREHTALALLVIAFLAALFLLAPAYWAVLDQSRRRFHVERQMSDLVESLPVTVWQLRAASDGTRRFIYVGHRAKRERGLAPEVIQRDIHTVYESILPEDFPRVKAAMDASERTLENFDERYRIRMPDGFVRWIHSSARLRREQDGAVLWNGYWSDITARQRLEDALEQATEEAQRANRAKSTFLATMSHEIRTPMNSILGLLELLSLSPLDAQQNATLHVVSESGRTLLRIIDDILDFSKVEAGRLEIDPVPASVSQLLARACEMHSGIARSRGLLLRQTVDSRISPALLFDPLRVGQILNNLIGNALKFTKKGSVTVATELVARQGGVERLRFIVQDTGIGVAPEVAQRLFQPFSQATAQTAARHGGSGLGLAICRRLAGLMDGVVEMQSEPSKGTTMTLTVAFPIADPALLRTKDDSTAQRQLAHALSSRRKAPSVAEAEREGTLVLVVDDHPTNRLVLSRQITALGYALETAEHGRQALALWRTGRFALVLTDCNMPQMSGYELARAIRSMEASEGRGRTPILGCTASALDSEAAQCIGAGMDDLVVKPVDLMELMDLFDLWLPLTDGSARTPAGGQVSPITPADVALDGLTLAAVSAGDKESEREILLDFRRINDGDAAELSRGVAQGKLDQVTHYAHRIRGAARLIGAFEVADDCERMEAAARARDLGSLEAMAPRLRVALERLNACIDSRVLPETSVASGHANRTAGAP